MKNEAPTFKTLPDEFTGNFIASELYLHPELNGVSDRELLGAICNLSRSNRQYTSIPYLAGLYGITDRNLRARIAKLEKLGFIVRKDRNKTTGRSNFICPTAKCYGGIMQTPDENIRPDENGAQPRMESTGTPDENILPPRMKTSDDSKINTKQDSKQDNKQNAHANAHAIDEWFSVFWSAYPLKKDKKRAHAAFCKIKPDQALWQKIHDGQRLQLTERQLKLERGEWMPDWKHAATWLNGACWEDSVDLREGTRQTGQNSIESWGEYSKKHGWTITAGLKTEQELHHEWQGLAGEGVVCDQ